MPLGRVRFAAVVPEDEIDLDSGFIMVPSAIPVAPGAPPLEPNGGRGTSPPVATGGGGSGVRPAVPPSGADTVVDLTFSAGRDGLFTAWNAIANLAEMAGTVTVTVHAESLGGFEKNRLQNGVLEPLREADLIE